MGLQRSTLFSLNFCLDNGEYLKMIGALSADHLVEKVETWVDIENLLLGHVHAFTDWGGVRGVPRNVLFDNMRSVVSERRGAALPCRPARGNEKGRVGRAIQYIRHSFFAAR
jgi:hypothetical protein